MLDLIEPIRPHVDAWALDAFDARHFHAAEFDETERGQCRIGAPLTHELIESIPEWATPLGEVIEQAAEFIAADSPYRIRAIGTPLTQHNRRTARWGASNPKADGARSAPNSCARCGAPREPHRRYCDDCLGDRRTENTAALIEAAARRRARGVTSTAQSRQRLGVASRRRQDELREWERAHAGESFDPDQFTAEILPSLKGFTMNQLAKATGLSKSYCHLILTGKRIPHPRHWARLKSTAEADD